MKFTFLTSLITLASTKQGNIDVMTFEALLQNNACNRDCIGYCLNYFPHHTILEKCGCMENQTTHEKFLINKNAKSVLTDLRSNNLVDPIIELYKTKILEIDSQIMVSGNQSNAEETTKDEEVKPAEKTPQVPEKTDLDEFKKDPSSDHICKKSDKSCLEKESSCMGTCDQKCKTEQKDKQKACINLCINQCMASFGIKPNHMRIITTNIKQSQTYNLARVSGHAQTLLAEGDWCPPSCTAQCGQIVLMGTGDDVPQQIVSCFRDQCKCNHPSLQLTDRDQYTKFQADLRVENLLLQSEVQDIITKQKSIQAGTNETTQLTYVDMGKQEYKTHNQLLEDIVIQSLKEAQLSFSNNSIMILVWSTFFALSFILMCLAAVFYKQSHPAQDEKDRKVSDSNQNGHYSLPCSKIESKDKQERLENLNEKLLQ